MKIITANLIDMFELGNVREILDCFINTLNFLKTLFSETVGPYNIEDSVL
jgi:hypothetical protein